MYLWGHFKTCPLGLVDKPRSVDLRMICHFSKDDQFGHSTNSWIDANDFPMCWFMATTIADFVSTLYPFSPSTISSLVPSCTTHILSKACSFYPCLFLVWAVEAYGFKHLPMCKFSVPGKFGPHGCLCVAF